MISTRLSAATT
jgi:hypothetical protein